MVTKMLDKAIMGILGITVLFSLYATMVPEAQSAGDELNASGVPLGDWFGSDGVVFILIMVALIVYVYREFKPSGRK